MDDSASVPAATTTSPRRVALVGSGGVGKTTLLKFFEQRGYKIFPSITREYYASRQIKDETDYMILSHNNKAVFQHGMRSFYRIRYTQFLADNSALNVVTDRSIIDHMAFGVYGLETTHTPASIERLIHECINFSNDAYTHLVCIPYPLPWMEHKSIDDGFRNTDAAKNYCISSLMFHTIMHEKSYGRLRCHVTMLDRNDNSPETNFAAVYHMLTNPQAERVVG